MGPPPTLTWQSFREIPNPGPGVLVANNGLPIVARVDVRIHFDPNGWGVGAGRRADGRWAFGSPTVAVVLNPANMIYVRSRIPRGHERRYLIHEQGHVDLMWLFAWELQMQLRGVTAPTGPALAAEAQRLTNEAVTNARRFAINVPGADCQYDIDTRHGMDERQQNRWNGIIARNKRQLTQPGQADYRFQT